jgi:methylenetetrahydrofolate dehydrogenase (NADP+)/methenyltetrahydrofolate cyclohydrolase
VFPRRRESEVYITHILKGAPVATKINEQTAVATAQLAQHNISPCLALVRFGESDADIAYERRVVKNCDKLHILVKSIVLPEDCSEAEAIHTLDALNAERAVHAVMLFRPLPRHMDDATVRNALDAGKDVDGITDSSLAGIFTGSMRGYAPCTAQACIEILDHYGIDIPGKRAVIVGRSLVVGKPVAMLLTARHATVTICHTHTVDLPAQCRSADILIACAGSAGLIGPDCVALGQTIIDAGINVLGDGQICGDVDFDAIKEIAEAVTPVPGGVGVVTNAILFAHVAEAARKRINEAF